MSYARDDYALTGEWLTSCKPADIQTGCVTDTSRPFVYPSGIAIDSSDSVYVVDLWTDKVQKFTSDGKFITKWGSAGSGDGELQNPNGLATDSLDNVYVVDQGNSRVQKFTSDGKFITKWGSAGSGDGEFRGPKGIAVDNSGDVIIVDQYNNRVQKFTSDGKFITKWGSKCQTGLPIDIIKQFSCPNPRDGEFYYPDGGIAIDSIGNVFVADTYNNRIQKFTSNGEFISKIQLPDYRNVVSSYSRLGPADLTISSNGKLFSTALNDKVLIYSPLCHDTLSVNC